LLRFELEHRAYFERWVNARDARFYRAQGVRAAIDAAEFCGNGCLISIHKFGRFADKTG
jgi:hypothetical protein